MQSLLKKIYAFFGKGIDEDTRRFAFSGSLGNAGVQLISMVLVFGTQILIARVGGEEAYGTYSQVFNWFAVLFVLSAFGSDVLLVKQIPIYEAEKNNAGIRGILFWTHRTVFFVALVVITVFAVLVNFCNIPGLANNAYYFNISLPGILLAALMIPHQAFLRGMKKVVLGQTADKIIKPIGLIIGILIFWKIGTSKDIGSYVWANVLAFGLAWLYAFILLIRNKKHFYSTEKIKIEQKEWWNRAAWFTLSGLLFMLSVRLDVLAVGSVMGNVQVGYYNVVLKYADLAAFPIFIISHSIAPLYSSFYDQGKKNELQSLFKNATRMIFFITLFIFLFFLFFGKIILGFFGASYVQGYFSLLILGGGKLFAAMIGPIGLLMMLLGFEKQVNLVLFIQILMTSIALYFLIPLWGLQGAAMATVLGIFIFNLGLFIILKKETGINGSVF